MMPKVSNRFAASGKKTETDWRPLFETFGPSFSKNGSAEALADGCPFCGKANHFYLNVETGLYDCKRCGESGNHFTFIRAMYQQRLDATTDADYQRLKLLRGLPLQTLKRHGLAWDADNGCWLIPAKSAKGEVMHLCRYFEPSRDKRNLPMLPAQLYGLDQLSDDAGHLLFLCEGPWDAMALDHHLRMKKTRDRYDILAVPSANTFKEKWVEFLRGRECRIVFDNDEAGQKGQQHVVKVCQEAKVSCHLSTLRWPAKSPDKCDLDDLVCDGVNVVEFTREHCVKVLAAERRLVFTRGDAIPEEKVDWLHRLHIAFGTFVSLSGLMGTHKSGIARYYAARGTAGLPMPDCESAVAAFDVLYFTSEDAGSRVRDMVRIHGGDLARLHVHDIAAGIEPIDLLDCMEEIEAEINARGARLVILDALNSFVGGDISTDSKARRTLSGRLQSLARRTGACIIGIRNWGRADAGSSSQRSLGATSLSDVARCVLNTRELEPGKYNPRRLLLEFEKVSDAPTPRPIPYHVEDLSTCEADSHMRRIVWGKPIDADALKEALARGKKKVAEKGSANGAPH